jgi:aerobic carbon-monoxide dehydrogenase medium subunit
VGVLRTWGTDAKVLAGGQSLIPMLNMRLARPRHIVDIARLDDLPSLEVTGDAVRIGAGVRQHQVEANPQAIAACPLLGRALLYVAHRAIRTRGTVVGSLVQADPAAELPAVLCLLGGRVTLTGQGGSREIEASELYRGYFETALRSDELAVAASFPRIDGDSGTAFVEVSRRHGDFALCAVGAVVSKSSGRVALAGVDMVPRVFDVTPALQGDGGKTIETLAAAIAPEGDIHASAEFRRHLAKVLTRRALAAAVADRDRASGRAGERGGKGE